MKHATLDFSQDFAVILNSKQSQAAVMVLQPGDSVGGPDNRHRGSDQWLYVVSGEGAVTIDGQTHVLRPETLVLIQQGETHDVQNLGDQPLRTLNFYVPRAYDDEGEPLANGRS